MKWSDILAGTFPYVHSYARQVLEEQRCKIFCNDAEVLPYKGKIYDIPEIKTRFPIGTSDFQPSDQIMRISTQQKLIDLGFKLVSVPFTGWFPGQKNKYIIVRADSLKTPLKDIPSEHLVEYDVINRALRIRGKNANWNNVGRWVLLNPRQNIERRKEDYQSAYLDHISQLTGENKKTEYLEIPENELPVMIDELGRIICIENLVNEPCIGIVGQRRMGNSWFMHGLTDRAYHRWGKHIAVMNDGLDETDTWCLPWQQHPSKINNWIRELNNLGEITAPLPCVYFTPQHRGITDEDLFFPKEVGFRTSLPFKDMLLDWENFTRGNERWTFKNSLIYFRQILFNDDSSLNERLYGARSFEEIDALLLEKWPPEDKRFETIYMRVFNVVRDIWNWQILDAANGIPAKWKVQAPDVTLEDLDPVVACLMCNLIPVIITRKIKNQSWFAQEFKYRLNQIFRAQVETKYFKRNRIQVWLVVDEILSIAATDNKTVASEEIERVVRESGPARIGFVYRAQNWNRVLKELVNNTGFCFAFKQNEESAKSILKHFGFPTRKGYVEELTALKKFELMAFTNNRFIAYDPVTGKRELIDDKPIRGRAIPPLSYHKPPKEDEMKS